MLSVRRHGETSAIVDLFTREHGRHAGVVRGGTSRKIAPILQPGAQLAVAWRARLEEHIGSYTVEPIRSRAAAAMGSRLALAGMNAAIALLTVALPEREPHRGFYERTEQLFDLLGQDEIWPLAYLHWEVAFLEEMGFGLDLSRCAVTGTRDGLCYVSPKTGRAVSKAGAGDWADRLLPLPACLLGQGAAPDHEVAQGFDLTGHFLRQKVGETLLNKPIPEARARFLDLFSRAISPG